MEELPVTKFREYLRIKSVHPEPDYDGAVAFLNEYAKELGLEVTTVKDESMDLLECVLMTWRGSDPSLPSLVLNSHTDVVPIYPEHWKYDAFAAHKDEKGNIFARGTQDMKCVGIQYLEAVRRLKSQGAKFKRNIHLLFVPDEEIGGIKGMQAFVKTDLFKAINVGFVLDEGLANPYNKYSVFYGERTVWWVKVSCVGNPGHGSRFVENNAPEKLRRILNLVLAYREEEKNKMENPDACITLGDVTTVNLTGVHGGVANNLVPAKLEATFDFRIAPTVDLEELESKLKKWCEEAGDDVTYKFIQKSVVPGMTVHDESSPWWRAFKKAIDDFGVQINTEVFPAATDSRFLRQLGYPAIGFSPIRNTPILLHDHNEFLNEKVFLEGLDCYCKLIPALANV